MTKHTLAELDRHPSGSKPLHKALDWLHTLIRSAAVPWEPGQKESAELTLAEAKETLERPLPKADACLARITAAYGHYQDAHQRGSFDAEVKALKALRDEVAQICGGA